MAGEGSSSSSEEEMATTVFQQELRTVLHWFTTWGRYEKQDFLEDLVNKATPGSIKSLFHAMETMKVSDKPPSIFQCQLKLFSDWFEGWTDQEKNVFVQKLEELSPDFMREANEKVNAIVMEEM